MRISGPPLMRPRRLASGACAAVIPGRLGHEPAPVSSSATHPCANCETRRRAPADEKPMKCRHMRGGASGSFSRLKSWCPPFELGSPPKGPCQPGLIRGSRPGRGHGPRRAPARPRPRCFRVASPRAGLHELLHRPANHPRLHAADGALSFAIRDAPRGKTLANPRKVQTFLGGPVVR